MARSSRWRTPRVSRSSALRVPLSEMFGYIEIASKTSGRAVYSMEFQPCRRGPPQAEETSRSVQGRDRSSAGDCPRHLQADSPYRTREFALYYTETIPCSVPVAIQCPEVLHERPEEDPVAAVSSSSAPSRTSTSVRSVTSTTARPRCLPRSRRCLLTAPVGDQRPA